VVVPEILEEISEEIPVKEESRNLQVPIYSDFYRDNSIGYMAYLSGGTGNKPDINYNGPEWYVVYSAYR